MFSLKLKYLWWLALVAGAVLLAFLCVSQLNFNPVARATDNDKQRLITIFDRGKEKIILSEATTVESAIKEAGIYLDQKDLVEPSLNEELVASAYNINIYRARPVTVIDGNLKEKIMTPYQTTEQIAKDAGLELKPEDKASMELADISSGGGAGLELKITRAKEITITLFSKTSVIRTQAKTVEELLKEKDIKLEQKDRSSMALNEPIQANMQLKIWREGKQTVTIDEEIAFGVEKIFDADRDLGYKAIKQPGVNGKRNVTYEITINDGVEVSRTEIASLVIEPAKAQIEVVGTKPKYVYQGESSKVEWMRQAGISESDFGYVDYIINRESRWNPNSVNASSGACGLAQALPCSKVPGDPLNPVDNLKWANSYAQTCTAWRRYCGWEGAYQFWLRNNWW